MVCGTVSIAPDRASIGRWFRGPIVTSMHRMLAGYVVQLLHDHVRADVFETLVGAGGVPVLSLRRLVPGEGAPSNAVECGWIREWGLRRGLLVVGYVGRDGGAVLVPRGELLLTLDDLSHVIVVGDPQATASSKRLGC